MFVSTIKKNDSVDEPKKMVLRKNVYLFRKMAWSKTQNGDQTRIYALLLTAIANILPFFPYKLVFLINKTHYLWVSLKKFLSDAYTFFISAQIT